MLVLAYNYWTCNAFAIVTKSNVYSLNFMVMAMTSLHNERNGLPNVSNNSTDMFFTDETGIGNSNLLPMYVLLDLYIHGFLFALTDATMVASVTKAVASKHVNGPRVEHCKCVTVSVP